MTLFYSNFTNNKQPTKQRHHNNNNKQQTQTTNEQTTNKHKQQTNKQQCGMYEEEFAVKMNSSSRTSGIRFSTLLSCSVTLRLT